jgi:hypothetical protein
VVIWENNFNDSLLDRQIIIGKDDWDRSEDDNEDGVVDDEDGGDAGQYDWNGIVSAISANGEWVVGYHTFNGTGYGSANQAAVGFRYNTVTKVLEDTLFAGCPTFVFDDGEMIFDKTGIMSSSDDKEVQCGTVVIAVDGLGQLNVPMLYFPNQEPGTPVENVVKVDVNVFVNDAVLNVEGEFTAVEIYSVLGANVASFDGAMKEINLSNLNKGVYLVRIFNGAESVTKKINL